MSKGGVEVRGGGEEDERRGRRERPRARDGTRRKIKKPLIFIPQPKLVFIRLCLCASRVCFGFSALLLVVFLIRCDVSFSVGLGPWRQRAANTYRSSGTATVRRKAGRRGRDDED